MIEATWIREAQLAELEECTTPIETLRLFVDPAALTQLDARRRLRAGLALPHRDCLLRDEGSCACLTETLDAFEEHDEAPTRVGVEEACAVSHREPVVRSLPPLKDALSGADVPYTGTGHTDEAAHPLIAAPSGNAVPAKREEAFDPERFRPIGRTRKWWDGDISILSTRF
jgi:hypothetical protein